MFKEPKLPTFLLLILPQISDATSIRRKHPGSVARLAQDTNNSFRHPEAGGI